MTTQPFISVLPLTTVDEPLLVEMMYQAIFVPTGGKPPPKAIVEEPAMCKYFHAFGTIVGDIGQKAVDTRTDKVVGAAWVRLLQGDSQGYGYVNDGTPELSIAVDPAYRGQGIGTMLMDHLFAAVAQQYTTISLSVWPENPAYLLYQRLGFVFVKSAEDGPAVTMIKYLDDITTDCQSRRKFR